MDFPLLNFAKIYNFKCKKNANQYLIYDIIRKKFYVLTPEEWVRQHIIHYLVFDKKIPKINFLVEKVVEINGMKKRMDLLIYKDKKPFLLVECKSPKTIINQETFDQIMRYNSIVDASILMITNGLNHIYARLDKEEKKYKFITDFNF
ncbi:MAG: type I restriction enzyme HsdR N-terminal domain-containing protein [Solirubrobacteraceae bacterium]